MIEPFDMEAYEQERVDDFNREMAKMERENRASDQTILGLFIGFIIACLIGG